MRIAILALLLAPLVVAIVGEHKSSASTCTLKDKPEPKHGIFDKTVPTLRAKTKVPLRLPTYFPGGNDETSLFPRIESADSSGYEINVGVTADCEGGNACRYGTLRGSTRPPEEHDGRRIPVSLARGIKGRFIDAQCFAFCSDSVVEWQEGSYYYAIGIKAEKMKTLIKVANSAITAGAH